MSAYGRTDFFIIGFAMANTWECLVGTQYTTTEPYCISLYHVLMHTNLDRGWLLSDHFLIAVKSIVDTLLNKFVKSLVKAIK